MKYDKVRRIPSRLLSLTGLKSLCKVLHKLFKQLKQNFPLKYFLGDNENAIIIQIWSVMLANIHSSLNGKEFAFRNARKIGLKVR